MPYIHVDYSQKLLNEEQLAEIVHLLLTVSGQAFNYNEEQAKELVSIFTTPYNKADHSLASAEIEVKAKVAEFDHETKSRAEIRSEKMKPYRKAFEKFINDNQLPAGIVFTITFEDWEAAFIPAAKS